VDDNTTLGSSNTDTVTFTARINSDFEPATDNTYDLGRTGHEWRDLYIDGTANIDSLIADTADINAGTIDNTSIGASTASTGAFTTLTTTGALTYGGVTLSNSVTGTGSMVLATSPTLVTPALGTPSSGTLTNCTFPTLNQNTTGTAANVTGTVAVANGGTGATSLTSNNVLLGNGTSAIQVVAPGTSGNVLTSDGTTWTSAASPAATIASTAEAEAGTNNTNFITPLRLREGFNASGSAPVYACRAWVNFNGTGTPAIRASGNVSSITDNGTGNYTVNFTTAMPDANYVAVGNISLDTETSAQAARGAVLRSKTTTSVRAVANASSGVSLDWPIFDVSIFR
jgi:hypothetical protein